MPCGHFFPLSVKKKPDACPKDLCPVSALALQEASSFLSRLWPVSSAARMTGPCLHPHLRELLRFPVCPGHQCAGAVHKAGSFFQGRSFFRTGF